MQKIYLGSAKVSIFASDGPIKEAPYKRKKQLCVHTIHCKDNFRFSYSNFFIDFELGTKSCGVMSQTWLPNGEGHLVNLLNELIFLKEKSFKNNIATKFLFKKLCSGRIM